MREPRSRRGVWMIAWGVVGSVAAGIAPASAQTCGPYFADMGPTPHTFFESWFTVYDDGTGSTLYRGDNLDPGLIRWTASGWQIDSLNGIAPGFTPTAPYVFLEPSGNRLYLGGRRVVQGHWVPEMYRWLGTTWAQSDVCTGACAPYEATGPRLAADVGEGLKFYGIGYRTLNADTFVVRWDDTHWTEIGAATNRNVSALVPYDDGAGLALYAIGDFRMFSGFGAEGMVKWNGQSWIPATPPDNRVTGRNEAVVADLGDGPAIYTTSTVLIDGAQRLWLNKWDGQQWSHPGHPDSGGYVIALAVFDDGRGPALYIGGNFDSYAGVTARNVVRYTPAGGFEPLGAGTVGEVSRLFPFLDQRGPSLYIGSDALTGAGGGVLRQQGALWIGCPNCYANCDLSTGSPALNVGDFVCFLQKFAARDPYANCDLDATINVNDFVCFSQKFAAGCQR